MVRWALQIPLRKENQAAWVEVERSQLGARQRVALRLVAAGLPVRAAAGAVGLANHADLSRNLRRFGFEPPDRATLGLEFRRIAGLGMHEWQRRLEEAPEKVPTNLLQVGVGIALDKASKTEGWERAAEEPRDRLAEFLKRLDRSRPALLEVESSRSVPAACPPRRQRL